MKRKKKGKKKPSSAQLIPIKHGKTKEALKKVNIKKLSPELQKELREIEKDIQMKEAKKERTWRDMRILWFSVAPYVKCYDEETEILTENGWKFFRDLKKRERVMTYNPTNSKMEYQVPIARYEYNYKGLMYFLDSKDLNLLVTPNHMMYVAKGKRSKKKEFKFEEAQKIIGKYRQYLKTGEWDGKDPKFFELPSLESSWIAGNKARRIYHRKVRKIRIEDWLEFLGYYFSEGYIDHNPIKGNYTIGIRQNKRNLYKMSKALRKVSPFKLYYYPTKVIVRDKQLWNYLKKFGYSWEKNIPKELKNLSPKLLQKFLKAYELGDGDHSEKRRRIFTSSVAMKDDIQEIAIKAGYSSNSRIFQKKGKEGNFGTSKYDIWEITLSKRKIIGVNKKKRSDRMIPYEGKIYCVQVPNHLLLIRRKGKTVFSSNSGYGVVTKHFVSRLIERGFTAMVVAYYGLQRGGFLKVGDIVTFPISASPGDSLGFKSVAAHHKKFNTDIVIFFTDFWVARPLTKLIKETVAYTVLDHEDYAEEYQDVLRGFRKVAIASKHGCREAKKYGVDATFIPHGVDLKTYFPLPKEACKKMLSVEKDTKVLGIVAANNDKEPRKGWDKMFSAIRIFLDNNKEMQKQNAFKVFVHTDARNERGYDLKLLAKRTGIGKYIIFQDPYMSIIGLPDRLMCRIYNAFDVLMNLARREGFCLPILEAQACRVPCIATDFSAMTERLNYGKCGWLVKPATTMLSPLGGITAIPDEFKAAEALEEAFFNKKKNEMFAKRSLAYARQQSWDIAVDKYWMPYLEEVWNELKAPQKKKAAKVLFKPKKPKVIKRKNKVKEGKE